MEKDHLRAKSQVSDVRRERMGGYRIFWAIDSCLGLRSICAAYSKFYRLSIPAYPRTNCSGRLLTLKPILLPVSTLMTEAGSRPKRRTRARARIDRSRDDLVGAIRRALQG